MHFRSWETPVMAQKVAQLQNLLGKASEFPGIEVENVITRTEKHPNGIFKHFRSWEPSIAQIIDKYIKTN
jgi:hypothetical protein